jgi:hypothetical protein
MILVGRYEVENAILASLESSSEIVKNVGKRVASGVGN